MNPPVDQRSYRLTSIDMLRGLVILIMPLDHTRDFFSVSMSIDPLNDPNVSLALAFTRWITHFCAPVFVFLAGTSAGLMVARKRPADLCRFLLSRGVWLIFVEVVILSTFVTFAPGGIDQLGGKTLAFMLIHVLALGLGALQGVPIARLLTFPAFFPKDYGVSLPLVYCVWLLVIVLLYPLCRWMADYKAHSRAWWLSYV